MGELITTTVLEKLKEQELRVSELEDNVLRHGNYFAEIEAENEEGRKDVEKLKERVSRLEENFSEYEEKFRVLTVQNIELRNHLNMTIDVVNKVVNTLNQNSEELTTCMDVQQDDDDDDKETTEEKDEPLTLTQVYDMFQSQPRDEETWQMMTDAINAAEEYEHEQPQTITKYNKLFILFTNYNKPIS